MAINKKHLRQLQTVILEEPKRLDMNHWVVKFLKADRKNEFNIKYIPPCKTVGCIAGWECTLHPKKAKELGWSGLQKYYDRTATATTEYATTESTVKVATELLGLTENQAQILFYPTAWPRFWYDKLVNKKEQTKAYAKVVANFIQEVIDTDGQNLDAQYRKRYEVESESVGEYDD